jgi:hypothetical protein
MQEDTDPSSAPEQHGASTIGGNVRSVFSSIGVYLVAAGALGVLFWWLKRKSSPESSREDNPEDPDDSAS